MNQEECLQIVRASTRARKYVVVQQNTVSAIYVVAYLVDLLLLFCRSLGLFLLRHPLSLRHFPKLLSTLPVHYSNSIRSGFAAIPDCSFRTYTCNNRTVFHQYHVIT